jgi:ribonuclease P protein component
MLPKQQRLHTAADFRKVRGRGRQWRSVSFLAFIMPARRSPARLGVIVSTKIGKAVKRKRAARILREGYTQIRPHLSDKDIVLIARPMIKGKTSGDINRELRRMTDVMGR